MLERRTGTTIKHARLVLPSDCPACPPILNQQVALVLESTHVSCSVRIGMAPPGEDQMDGPAEELNGQQGMKLAPIRGGERVGGPR